MNLFFAQKTGATNVSILRLQLLEVIRKFSVFSLQQSYDVTSNVMVKVNRLIQGMHKNRFDSNGLNHSDSEIRKEERLPLWLTFLKLTIVKICLRNIETHFIFQKFAV